MVGNAKMDIVLENSLVVAGSWLKGYVLVNVHSGGVSAVALELFLRGKEYTEVEYSEQEETSDDRRRSVRRTETASRSIVDMRIPVNDMSFIVKNGNRVDPGQYQIPFSLELPSFLPGSMAQYKGSDGCCKIEYSLRAVLKGSGMLWDYSTEKPVGMIAKPLDANIPPTPFNADPINERVNFCCCFNKGSITLGAKVEQTSLSPGSDVSINMSVRNYSTAQPRKIHARLRQEITWRARGRTCNINESIVVVDFPSILSSILRQRELPGTVHSALIHNEMQDIFREIEDGVHEGRLIVPTNALSTYSGHLITVKHRLELEVQTGCCITDPTIYVPVMIAPSPITSSEPTSSVAPAQNQNPDYTPPMVASGVVQAPIVVVGAEETLPVIHVPSSNVYAVDGGAATAPYEEDVQVAPSAEVPSISLLLREMKGTASHLDLVERRVKNPDWANVLRQTNPTDFRKIVGLVQMGFDQPSVAEVIAREIGSNFRCEYVAAALRASMDFQRCKMVETLVPYCSDIRENQDVIRRDLSEWEVLVTERALSHAMERS